MSSTWHTAWQHHEIVVYKSDAEVDRFAGKDIQRVIFVYQNRGETPGDLVYAAVELPEDWLLLPAETGFSGRVNFERQSFWEEKACVYWVPASQAPLPARFRRGRWLLPGTVPPFARVPKSQMGAALDTWPLDGPQTYEQRKWLRIQRSRPFTSASAADKQPSPKVRT